MKSSYHVVPQQENGSARLTKSQSTLDESSVTENRFENLNINPEVVKEAADDVDNSELGTNDCKSKFETFFRPFFKPLSVLEGVILGFALFIEFLKGLLLPLLYYIFGEFVNAMFELDRETQIARATTSSYLLLSFSVAVPVILFTNHFMCQYISSSVVLKYQKVFLYFLTRVDMVWLDNQGVEGIEAWMDLCLHGYDNATFRGAFHVVKSIVNIVSTVVLLFTLSWQLTLISILAVGVFFVGFVTSQRLLTETETSFVSAFHDLTDVFRTTKRHIKYIYASGMQQIISTNVAEKLRNIQKADSRRRSTASCVQGFFGAMMIIIVGTLFWYSGAHLIREEDIDVARLGGIVMTILFSMSNLTMVVLRLPGQLKIFLNERQRLIELHQLFHADSSCALLFATITLRKPEVNGSFAEKHIRAMIPKEASLEKEKDLKKKFQAREAVRKLAMQKKKKKLKSLSQSNKKEDKTDTLKKENEVDECQANFNETANKNNKVLNVDDNYHIHNSESSSSDGSPDRSGGDGDTVTIIIGDKENIGTSSDDDSDENLDGDAVTHVIQDTESSQGTSSSNGDNGDVNTEPNQNNMAAEEHQKQQQSSQLDVASATTSTLVVSNPNIVDSVDTADNDGAMKEKQAQSIEVALKNNNTVIDVPSETKDKVENTPNNEEYEFEQRSTADISKMTKKQRRKHDELTELSQRESQRRKYIDELCERLEVAQPASTVTLDRVTFTRDVATLRERVLKWRIQKQRENKKHLKAQAMLRFLGKGKKSKEDTVSQKTIQVDDLLLLQDVSFCVAQGEALSLTGTNPRSLEAILHLISGIYPAQPLDFRKMANVPLEDPSTVIPDRDTSLITPALVMGSVEIHARGLKSISIDTACTAQPTTYQQTEMKISNSLNNKQERNNDEEQSLQSKVTLSDKQERNVEEQSLQSQGVKLTTTTSDFQLSSHVIFGIKIGVFSGNRRSIFHGTILENISLLRRGVTRKDVGAVCHQVRILKIVQTKFKKGFQQVIDPLTDLSDLECSQILLARALVGSPSLLILDRPLQSLPRGTLDRALLKAVLKNVLEIERSANEVTEHPQTKRSMTVVARFEYCDDARDCTDRVVVVDQGKVIESGLFTEVLHESRLHVGWFAKQLAAEELSNYQDEKTFSTSLHRLCTQLHDRETYKKIKKTEEEEQAKELSPEIIPDSSKNKKSLSFLSQLKQYFWSGKEPVAVAEAEDVKMLSHPPLIRLFKTVFPKMIVHLLIGILVAFTVSIIIPAFAYASLDALRTLSSCNPVTIPYYVDINISVGIEASGSYNTHDIVIHDRCFDYPYAQASNGQWSTTSTWLDHGGYNCSDYQNLGWCADDSLANNITIETLHQDADSDGFCDNTLDNCTFPGDDPNTRTIEIPQGPVFKTGSGLSWGCDCNTSLAQTGYVFDEPWYANMTCCQCGGGRLVNTFYQKTSNAFLAYDAEALVEFFANVTLYGCSSVKTGTETYLDCDNGDISRSSCILQLRGQIASKLEVFLVLAAAFFLGWIALSVTFDRIHSVATLSLREAFFDKLMCQDIEWHLRHPSDVSVSLSNRTLGGGANAWQEMESISRTGGTISKREAFDWISANSARSSQAMHRRPGIPPMGRTGALQPDIADSGLLRLWRDGVPEVNGAVVDMLNFYLQFFVSLGVLIGFAFNLHWKMAFFFVFLELGLFGLYLVLHCCPLYAANSFKAVKKSSEEAERLIRMICTDRHLLRPLQQWAGERYDLPRPPPTNVAIAISEENYVMELAAARAAFDARQKKEQSGCILTFEGPPKRGPPKPLLNLSDDINDPRLPWALRKFDRIQRPGRSQHLLLGAWNGFKNCWPISSQLIVLTSLSYYMVELLVAQETSGDTAIAIIVVGMLSLRHIMTLSYVRGKVQRARKVAPKLFAIVDRQIHIDPMSEDDLKIENERCNGTIVLTDVSFRYPGSLAYRDALSNITFQISAGETVGLLGTPGSGRTTLLHMLLRLYDPKVGSVELDGISLVALQPLSLRQCFGYVPTQPVIFQASIRDNITMGDNDTYSMDDVKKVLEIVELSDFVNNLPNMTNTIVEGVAGLANFAQTAAIEQMRREAKEREADEYAAKLAEKRAIEAAGNNISANAKKRHDNAGVRDSSTNNKDNSTGIDGDFVDAESEHAEQNKAINWGTQRKFVALSPFQAQLISIARVVLRKPNILLFDAITRNLTNRLHQKKLRQLWKRITDLETAVIVSDMISDVISTDKIVVMHRGEVVEMGSHVDLLVECRELYTSMCLSQNVSTHPDSDVESEDIDIIDD